MSGHEPKSLPKLGDSALAWALVQHYTPVRRYVGRLLRDPAEAEDATQETFLRAQERLCDLNDPGALTAWLYRIATHVCTDRLRAAARRAGRAVTAVEPGREPAAAERADVDTPSLDEALDREGMSACVQDYLAALPDPYRAALLLHDAEGLTGPEIAALLGVSLETVKIRLHRARTRLRAALSTGCDFSRDRRGVFVCAPRRGE